MPKSSFAIPARKNRSNKAGRGAYPIEDKAHARNALARVSRFGTPAEKSKVRSAVKRRYPTMGSHPQGRMLGSMPSGMGGMMRGRKGGKGR